MYAAFGDGRMWMCIWLMEGLWNIVDMAELSCIAEPVHIESLIHNDTMIKTQEERHRKASLQLHLPLTLFVKVRKGCMWEGAGDRT